MSVASRLLSQGFGDYTQVYIRILLGAAVGALLFSRSINWKKFVTVPKKDWIGILLMGVVGYGLVVIFITKGVLNTSLINTSVLYSTLPFFTYIFSLFVFKKKPGLASLALVAVSFWGSTIIVCNSFIPSLSGVNSGDVFVILAAAAGSWYLIGRKITSNYLNNRELTTVVMLIAGLCALAAALVTQEPLSLTAFTSLPVLLGVVMGAGLNLFVSLLENFGYKELDQMFASQLLLFENVFALILGVLLYKESVSLTQAIGALIIIISVYAANRYQLAQGE